jgi:chromosome segregation ATPase
MNTERKTVEMDFSGLLILLIIVIAGIIILKNKAQIDQLNQQNANLNNTVEIRDSLINELILTFNEIEQNLSFSQEIHNQMANIQQESLNNQKEPLIANVKLLNELLSESSTAIDELDKRLKSSRIEIKSFKNKITQLSIIISEQDKNIRQYRTEIEKRDNIIVGIDTKLVKLRTN